MNIVCLIDSLGPGGAQRQLTSLAAALARRGHNLAFVTYHRQDFFKPVLDEAGIPVYTVKETGIVDKLMHIRTWLDALTPDVVLAFMTLTSPYAEVSRILGGKWGLVVSERNAPPRIMTLRERFLRTLHYAADFVVTNSHTNRLLLEQASPRLVPRLVTIYNMLDLQYFRPDGIHVVESKRTVRLLALGRYHPQKNILRLIEAIARTRMQEPTACIQLDWYGDVPDRGDGARVHPLYDTANAKVRSLGLKDTIHLHGITQDVLGKYEECDAVVLPSLYEGLPNVVCEALAMGKPVLTSNVCDAGNLVHAGENGFLFDPYSVDSIAGSILSFLQLSGDMKMAMGYASRKIAEDLFGEEKIASAYESLLQAAWKGKRPASILGAPPVPCSALETLQRYQKWGVVPVRKNRRGPAAPRVLGSH